MKKVLSVVAIAFVFLFSNVSQSSAMGFTDVSEDHRFVAHMNYLLDEGVIKGFGNDKFGPDQAVTRASAAIMLAKALNLDTSNPKTGFKDVSESSKAAGSIQAMKVKGIITGFPDGKFYPDREVTRAEMSILLAKAFELKEKAPLTFTDVSKNMKSYEAIQKVVAFGIATGYTDEKFSPNVSLTRAQFSAFLARAMSEEFRLETNKPGEDKVTEAEALAISKLITNEFRKKVTEVGEENGWGILKPGNAEVAAPVLKEFLSKRFMNENFKVFIEDFYCDCDHDTRPRMDNTMIRVSISDITKDSFTVTGLYLDKLMDGPYFQSINFVVEDGKWKIDIWDEKMVTDEVLDLSKEEVLKAYPGIEIIGEFYSEEVGSIIYEIKGTSEEESSGIIKKNGKIHTWKN